MNNALVEQPENTKFIWRGVYPYLVIPAFYLLAMALISPFREVLLDDSWSYALTVESLLETGRIRFPATVQSLCVPHIFWGALWAKLFGYSFGILRLSNLALSLLTTLLFYRTLRLVGLETRSSLFAALTLLVCPTYFIISYTFQADINFTFFLLLNIYLLIRYLKYPRSSTFLLLTLAAAIMPWTRTFGLLIAPLVAVAFGLIHRQEKPQALLWLCFWLLYLVSSYLSWRTRGYFQPEALDFGKSMEGFISNTLNVYPLILYFLVKLFYSLLFFSISVAPLALGYWSRRQPVVTRKRLTAFLILILFLPLLNHLVDSMKLSMGNMLMETPSIGSIFSDIDYHEVKSVRENDDSSNLGLTISSEVIVKHLILTVIVLFVFMAGACFIASSSMQIKKYWGNDIVKLLIILLLPLWLVLIPMDWFFDRYLLPLLPLFLILIFLLNQGKAFAVKKWIPLFILLAILSGVRVEQYLADQSHLWKAAKRLNKLPEYKYHVDGGYAFTCYHSHYYYWEQRKSRRPRLLSYYNQNYIEDYCPGMQPKVLLFFSKYTSELLKLRDTIDYQLFGGFIKRKIYVYEIVLD